MLAFGGFLILGNAAILGTSLLAQWVAKPLPVPEIAGISNLRAVDGRVWRGGQPSVESFPDLVANGVSTIVDLRSEPDAADADPFAETMGLDVVHLPVRDGQIPTRAEIDSFLDVVEHAEGTVFLHCGAGVGRTGAMAAAYLVMTGQASPRQALSQNLSVGPPSLEQIAFVSGLGDGRMEHPGLFVTTISRVLDAPRRLASYL